MASFWRRSFLLSSPLQDVLLLRDRGGGAIELTGCAVALWQARGVNVVPFQLNYSSPVQDIITVVMLTETAAAFDFWQRSGAAETNRRQDFWPPLLRLARLIPSVEYIQARTRAWRMALVLDLHCEAVNVPLSKQRQGVVRGSANQWPPFPMALAIGM